MAVAPVCIARDGDTDLAADETVPVPGQWIRERTARFNNINLCTVYYLHWLHV